MACSWEEIPSLYECIIIVCIQTAQRSSQLCGHNMGLPLYDGQHTYVCLSMPWAIIPTEFLRRKRKNEELGGGNLVLLQQ